MPDTDTLKHTKAQTILLTELSGKKEAVLNAIKLFYYAQALGKDDMVKWFEKHVELLDQAGYGGKKAVEWSTDDDVFIQALEDFQKEFGHVLTDQREKVVVQSVVPEAVAEDTAQELIRLRLKKKEAARDFAKRLTDGFIAQTNKSLRDQGGQALSEQQTRALWGRVSSTVQEALAQSGTPEEARRRVEQYLVGALAFLPETQVLVERDTASRIAYEAVRPYETIVDQVFEVSRVAKVALLTNTDKPLMVKIFSALRDTNPSASFEKLIEEAVLLTPLAQSLNASVDSGRSAPVLGDFLPLFTKTGLQKTAAAVSAVLPPAVRDAIETAIVKRSWEKAVDAVTKEAGGKMAPSLVPLIQHGNNSIGVGSARPSSSLTNSIADFMMVVFGSPSQQMLDYLHLQQLNARLPEDKKIISGKTLAGELFAKTKTGVQSEGTRVVAAVVVVEEKAYFLLHLLYGSSPWVFSRVHDAGGFLRLIFDFGKQEAVSRGIGLATKTVVAGAGTAAKKVTASFFAGLLTKFGLSAAADVVLALVGTPIATTIKWAAQAAIWVGGFLLKPLMSFAGRVLRGDALPFGIGSALRSMRAYAMDAFGTGQYPTTKKKIYEQDWFVIIVLILIVVLLPMLGVYSVTSTQNAALITSLVGETGIPTSLGPALPSGSGSWPVTGCITQGPFAGFSHNTSNAVDIGASTGDPVYAVLGGMVTMSMGVADGVHCDVKADCIANGVPPYGNLITVEGHDANGNPYTVRYAHLQNTLPPGITEGVTIAPGQHIGYVDNTGYSTGSHLHFEYSGGARLDQPNTVLPYAIPSCLNKAECASLLGSQACVSGT